MPDQAERIAAPGLIHGAETLPWGVTVDAYGAEIRAGGGFLGDQASSRAFGAILDHWRARLHDADEDPLGDTPTDAISRRQLDRMLAEGDWEAGGLVHGVVEEFAQSLAEVAGRLLDEPAWHGTECVVVGGGMRGSRVGELAIGRASVLLKGEHGRQVDLAPIRHDPDEAGLVGCAHLAPPGLLSGHDGLLAVDIGGTNIRAGVVETRLGEAPDLSAARVWASELWRHAAEKPEREEAIGRLLSMLRDLAAEAERDGFRLAPLVGVGCPGRISEAGRIERGGQNLPGNWEGRGFSLPGRIRGGLPCIGGRETAVVVHNDAVVQGLSQAPWMRGVRHWAVLTIGTGLGNASFTNSDGGG
jgi:predicted NBD/HSP70 family sugar kinase